MMKKKDSKLVVYHLFLLIKGDIIYNMIQILMIIKLYNHLKILHQQVQLVSKTISMLHLEQMFGKLVSLFYQWHHLNYLLN